MKHLLTYLLSFIHFAVYAQYKIGDTVRPFALQNTKSELVSLEKLCQSNQIKGVIIIFTCNHCPYSKAYEDRIIAIDKKYSPLGFPVLAINPNDPISYPEDNFENMQKRAAEKGFTFHYLWDETQEIAKQFGATKTPHVYILSKSNQNSELKVEYIGAIDDNSENSAKVKEKYVEKAVDALLKGKKPNPNFTKAIGCSIKWKK
ncbi:MAG: thioredoxin family protein [Bacteroidia bacterium]|nr:thioredoxin family protein [Bacteroidia bacterium]